MYSQILLDFFVKYFFTEIIECTVKFYSIFCQNIPQNALIAQIFNNDPPSNNTQHYKNSISFVFNYYQNIYNIFHMFSGIACLKPPRSLAKKLRFSLKYFFT